MDFAPALSRRRSAFMVRIVLAVALFCASVDAQQQGVMSPVTTVNDAVFRSRWAGQQSDQNDALALLQAAQGITPVEDFATKFREGLHLGSLRFRPGLGAGWEYSDRNSQGGVTTDTQDNQSFYFAPSLGLEYARDGGPWSLATRYDGGYTFFLNPNYSANGTGSARNPFNNSGAFSLGHSGPRHTAQLGLRGSYGNGENVQAGGDTTTFYGAVALSYDYLINEFLTTGVYSRYDTQITRYEDANFAGSDLTSLRGGAYLDWLWTGKTTLGVKIEAGRLTSQIVGQKAVVLVPTPVIATATTTNAPTETTTETVQTFTPVVVDVENETQSRQFVQLLGTAAHNLTAKTLLVGGLGASYTTDQNIDNVNSQYTGVRPIYLLGVQYEPSEKSSARFYTTSQGTDVVPSYGLNLTWRPRLTTTFNLSVYQNQNFSLTSLSQYQVNRGFVLGAQQVLFSKLTVGLSGGWQQTENVSLSTNVNAQNSNDYAFLSGNLSWRINSWASWNFNLRSSSGYGAESSNVLDLPETTASLGLNLLF